MGLIDLKTDLKSLRYGHDQRGGGSSNQPYVVTPIPDGFAPTSPDFLLRNGYLNPIDSLVDASRLTKWFGDTKSAKGILFTAKQELLERQNVKIPGGFDRIYNPLGTIAQAGVLSTGYHLNKQGLNPFDRGYFNGGREGYFYATIAGANVDEGVNGGENRLALLYTSKIPNQPLGTFNINPFGITNSSDQVNLLSYSGGPGSILGIGNTNIRFTGTGRRERTNTYFPGSNNDVYVFNNEQLGNSDSRGKSKSTILSSLTDYREIINGGQRSDILPQTPYNEFNREKTYSTGVTEYKPQIRLINPNKSYEDRIDGQNELEPQSTDESAYEDIIKFYFEIINNNNKNNNFLFFRAYLNNISDNFKADWNSYKYIGRAENFYKYGGFSRDISLSFTIYAHTRAEMIPIYKKINKLAGVTAPDYSDVGLMRGNFIRMTVGDYLDNTPGIIQSISLKPSFEAGWDINRGGDGTPLKPESDNQDGDEFVGQLPRMIEVDLSFTPIHNFTPTNNNIYIGNEGII